MRPPIPTCAATPRALAAPLLAACLAGCGNRAAPQPSPSTTSSASLASSVAAPPTSASSSTSGTTARPLAPGLHLRPFTAPEQHGVFLRGDARALGAWQGAPNADDGSARLAPVELWDLGPTPRVRMLPAPKPPSPVAGMGTFFWPKDDKLVAASTYYGVAVWDVTTLSLRAEETWVEALVELNHAGDRLLVADEVGGAGVLRLQSPWKSGRSVVYSGGLTGSTHDLVWINDTVGAVLLTGKIVLLDGGSGAIRREISIGGYEAPPLAVSPKGDLFAVAYWDGRVELIDGKSLATKKVLVRPPAAPGKRPAVGSAAEVETETPLDVHVLAYGPDGKSVVGLRQNSSIVAWDTTTGAARSIAESSECTSLLYEGPRLLLSPDGARLLCIAKDGWLQWDMERPGAPKKLPAGSPKWLDGGARLAMVPATQDSDEVWFFDSATGSQTVRKVALAPSYLPVFSDDYEYRATSPSDTRVERVSDGRALRLRALSSGAFAVPAVYTEDGYYSGSDEVCRAILVRVDASGAETDPTPADCADRRRPDLAANFFRK